MQQLKASFKRTANWNKYQSKVTIQAPKPYLDFLINQMFQAVNGISVLRFENKDERTMRAKYYLPAIEISDYNVSIGG